jgi:hypothetical protein
MRARLGVYKDRIDELESVTRRQKDEIGNNKTLEEKIETLKNTVLRKDGMIRSQNEQLEKYKVDLLSLREINASKILDLEKANRVLKRQLDVAENKYQELSKESAISRERLLMKAEEANDECARLQHLLEETLGTHKFVNESTTDQMSTSKYDFTVPSGHFQQREVTKGVASQSSRETDDRVSMEELEEMMRSLTAEDGARMEQRRSTDENPNYRKNTTSSLFKDLNLSGSSSQSSSTESVRSSNTRKSAPSRDQLQTDIEAAERRLKDLVKKSFK